MKNMDGFLLVVHFKPLAEAVARLFRGADLVARGGRQLEADCCAGLVRYCLLYGLTDFDCRPGDLSDSVCQQRHTGFYGPLHRSECAALQFRSRPAGLVPRVGNLLLFAGAVSRETRTDVYRSDDRREPLLRMTLQGTFGFSGDPWSFRFFPSEIALFLAGSLGYYVYASDNEGQRTRAKTLLSIVAVVLFVCLAINRWDGIPRLASLSLLALVIVAVPRLFEMTRTIAWDKYIGELSYPLYIGHFLFGGILLPNTSFGVYLALFMSLAGSSALYHLFHR